MLHIHVCIEVPFVWFYQPYDMVTKLAAYHIIHIIIIINILLLLITGLLAYKQRYILYLCTGLTPPTFEVQVPFL